MTLTFRVSPLQLQAQALQFKSQRTLAHAPARLYNTKEPMPTQSFA